MSEDLFSNTVGFLGNTSFSLRYLTNTRNLRYTWPHSNVFARGSEGNTLFQSVLKQQVGIDRSSTYREQCSELEPILQKFVNRHAKTSYVEVLKKCDPRRFSEDRLQPIPKHIVREYVHRLVHNVVPLALFGNDAERRVFERNVRQILHLGKAQVFSLNMLMKNVRTESKTYLRPLEGNFDKTNLMAKLYLWVLRCYVFAALKCVFYVTDSNESKEYSFYTKHTWQRIQQRTFNRMKTEILGSYKNCLISRAIRRDDLFVLRILPKRRGGRPIFMKWKQRVVKKSRFSVSLNRMVRQFFFQLARENLKYVHTLSNFHEKWKTLFFRWTAAQEPPVYFVKADFSDAYGSILHTKLLQSIEKLVRYHSKREIEIVDRKHVKKVPVRYIFAVIKDYVTKFVYKHNKNVYKLIEGISQGGPLSSILCNFYFGQMDLQHLTEFGEDSSGFLVRNCDDYLYVTLDVVKAHKFLNRLSEGFPDYNLKLNDAKTETNIFPSPAGASNLVKISTLEVDVNSFQLYRSFHSYENSSIFHTSFLRTVSCPGRILAKRLPLWTELNLEQPFFDALYNSPLTILCNIFQSANLTAARFISFIEVLFRRYNDVFILKHVFLTASRMTCSVLRKAKNLGDEVGRALVTWIILKAFLFRFKRVKQVNRCAVIIKRIQSVLLFWLTKFNASEIKFLERLRSDERALALRCIL